jgi:DNA replication protein DnaC
MSRKDYEQLCSELDNTRQKDPPRVYDTLSQEAREVLQYWIEHAIQPALKADEHYSSYGLKHEYERETKLYVSHAQFKGAMLIAGYLPTEKGEQNWHFKIKPTYDVSSQNKRARLPAYTSTPQGEQDPQLDALVQKALASHRGDDLYSVMI